MEDQEASRRLCEDISKLSDGTCFLAFSRGKDALAAWLRLREYFDRVIPFHCASVPHLSFVDDYLTYCEKWFQTPILRYLSGRSMQDFAELVYAAPGTAEEIQAMDLWAYTPTDIATLLRRQLGLPHAWVAYGIAKADSIFRRSVSRYQHGRDDAKLSFHPCFDWKKEQIVDAIRAAGLRLPADYRLGNRTMSDTPGGKHLDRLREQFPADFERVKLMFPLIEAELARQHFRRKHFGAA